MLIYTCSHYGYVLENVDGLYTCCSFSATCPAKEAHPPLIAQLL